MDRIRVRILLRVSSTGQLDADGNMDIQRRIVLDYIKKQEEDGWYYDGTEYFEGGVSGYKNSVKKRVELQKILKAAENHEFDILVCYKDDRIGRRGMETLDYVMKLAQNGVIIYTTIDGRLTPKGHFDELLGFIRFWHAESSSIDTGQRVHDAAIEQVKMGKNMGGKAPYGYELVPSGELSKHQRMLKKKVKVPEKVEVVLHIYDLAIKYRYGFTKIAKLLNEDEYFRKLSPNGESWKGGTVRSILMNPIYTGYEAYDRRRHKGDEFKRLDRSNWIFSEVCNEELKIMEVRDWEKAQNIREDRKAAINGQITQNAHIPQRTTGILSLIDVAYCAHCGSKLTNGTKYSYWKTKDGEEHKRLVGYYRCQSKQQGVPCEGVTLIRADELEETVFPVIKGKLGELLNKEEVSKKLEDTRKAEETIIKREHESLRHKVEECEKNIQALKREIPKALRGISSFSPKDLNEQLAENEADKLRMLGELANLESEFSKRVQVVVDIEEFLTTLLRWRDEFDSADVVVKRMIINKMVDRIDVSKDGIQMKMNVNLDDFLHRNTIDLGTTPYKLCSR